MAPNFPYASYSLASTYHRIAGLLQSVQTLELARDKFEDAVKKFPNYVDGLVLYALVSVKVLEEGGHNITHATISVSKRRSKGKYHGCHFKKYRMNEATLSITSPFFKLTSRHSCSWSTLLLQFLLSS